jgi:hypothetical protein
MTIQTQTTPARLSEFVVALPIAEPIYANPCDYGFDFDAEELAPTSLPASLPAQSLPEVDALEFEAAFHYFLS